MAELVLPAATPGSAATIAAVNAVAAALIATTVAAAAAIWPLYGVSYAVACEAANDRRQPGLNCHLFKHSTHTQPRGAHAGGRS
eukprot:1136591-Pelagomonas_calceolata.AAC.1